MENKREIFEEASGGHADVQGRPAEHHGKHFDMPLRTVVPKPLQKPHPPLWVACSQLETLAKCGEWGMGALGFQFVSADAAHAWVHAYYNAFVKRQKKLADYRTNPNIALVSFFMCAKTDEEARARADGDTFFQFALRFYGAAPAGAGRPPARSTCGTSTRSGSRPIPSAMRGAARRPDRLARHDPRKLRSSSRPTSTRSCCSTRPAATRTSTSANRSSCSPRK
jgi:alkanesulfonate monooxygenase SsuD/methylene tetrahydromethanopterin reductase-like flavin-dependent oxidoreductase (luciferase family)